MDFANGIPNCQKYAKTDLAKAYFMGYCRTCYWQDRSSSLGI